MVDIEFIVKNRALYEQSVKDRNLDPVILNLDKIIEFNNKRKKLITQIDSLRKERNILSDNIAKEKNLNNKTNQIEKSKNVKEKLQKFEKKLEIIENSLKNLLLKLPNIISPKMPRGKDSNDNLVIKEWGNKPKFHFKPKDHIELGKIHDLIDIETSAKISGSRFFYLKNDLVLMQFALFSFVLKKLIQKGFIPIIPPIIVKEKALEGTGYFPFEAAGIYKIAPLAKEKEPKYLVGTSEVSIVSYHADTIFHAEELPKKYVGYSSCFRTEVGSWGRDVKGIKRVHQFDKIEMIYFTTQESSEKLILEVLAIEEEILQDLNLPYRVLDMCSGDVGMPTYRKFDLEVWLPSQESYMEVMSNSDLWEYQARRLNIRYKSENENKYVHTISATAITNTRPLLAILENYQKEDGSIEIPTVLREYMGKNEIKSNCKP